ncbi:MAG: HAMP domain-containing histidine kinase [Trichocoleus desertorum ATA4-8-CV12]|jgi:signal transduction histidine kinase|nr:HAMP domain-containing histidine kinase [Trichocoleus desertorum ATA4-8-CV12]
MARRKIHLSLSLRLFLVNLLALALGVAAIGIAYTYRSQKFSDGFSKIVKPNVFADGRNQNQEVIELFNQINAEGIVLALLFSLLSAAGLSIFMTYVLTRPLKKIEWAAKRFSEGDIESRIPPLAIPELHHLGLTLNSVANRLQGVEERRQALISEVSHEMSTPLMIISGYLEMIAEGRLPSEEVVDVAQTLLTDAERMQRLLSDLRMLARIELGSLPLNLQVVQPQPLIAEVIRALAIQERQEVCRLILECPEALPPIFADPDRTRQILVNLVTNALNYTLEGSVIVSVSYDSKYLWVSVTDTGIGISAEDLRRVFDRFWRSARSREMRQEGSGIGLALTKRLLEAQSGRIEVESELGQGSMFRFCLPLAEP